MNNKKIINKEILEKIKNISEQINVNYTTIDIICILPTTIFFLADLIKYIKIPTQVHYFSYNNIRDLINSGEVEIVQDVKGSLKNKNLLILDGVIISGKTPFYIYNYFLNRGPNNINFCVIGYKPKSLKFNIPIKYFAFEFENEHIVGYGIGNSEEHSLNYLIDKNEL
jgi:hypoxanthine phosphoribosyltransferase